MNGVEAMQQDDAVLVPPSMEVVTPTLWYAVHTRSRHEKKVVAELEQAGITHYLPLISEVHHWSDRRKVVQVPLFDCYVFVALDIASPAYFQVVRIPGVLKFVGSQNQARAIDASQIDDIRRLVESETPLAPYPFIKVGQKVRIRGGALDGMEGILSDRQGNKRLILSVDSIERSMAISIEGYDIEPV